MVAPLLLTVVLLLVVAGLAWLALTHERVDETDRFNRARLITSSWAETDPSVWLGEERPVRVPDDEGVDYQR
jgi:hypothetical protein